MLFAKSTRATLLLSKNISNINKNVRNIKAFQKLRHAKISITIYCMHRPGRVLWNHSYQLLKVVSQQRNLPILST
jgi:hypothetical protein